MNLNEKEIDFLQPLRNRPDKDPDKEFINRLQRRLIQSSQRKMGLKLFQL